MDPISAIMIILLVCFAVAIGILLIIFVLVPLIRVIAMAIGAFFKGIGWFIAHIFEFIGGTISDFIRLIGAVIAGIVLAPMALVNVGIGRWSAAGHFADSVKREFRVAGLSLYRMLLRRPLKLFWLHGLLEGVEERVPQAFVGAPPADRPGKRTGDFEGYEIVGSLRSGGSGAKLFVAKPEPRVLARHPGMPERVVIKSFALSEGSSLPQIVRESRALECAKQLGQIFDHGLDDRRFYYVMPYHDGDHLGVVTRHLHAESAGDGLERKQLRVALGYVCDLLETLAAYHRGGLWHKDVKPENVIVKGGRAHLVDLGLVTPLRSAMTLTTHGTEYFRDPEMVRQALRGVKIHQVNGAKFDVFAVGAVLYFLIENTFPAHGALSRFVRTSPECLRWIVRRAMADYHHRYESADAMLADMRCVTATSDAFTIKPAHLPSMRGGGVEIEEPTLGASAEPASVDRAAFASAGGASSAERTSELPNRDAVAGAPPDRGERPQIELMNWWTGSYRVGVPGSDVPQGKGPRSEREAASMYRRHAAELRRRVRAGSMSAGRAAREQIQAARTRAKDMRRRARSHRRTVAERQPSMTLALLGFAALAGIAAIIFAIVRADSNSTPATLVLQMPGMPDMPDVPGMPMGLRMADRGKPVLLVPQVTDVEAPAVAARLAALVGTYRESGYDVIVSQSLLDRDGVRELYEHYDDARTVEAERALEDALEAHSLYGLLVVRQEGKVTRKGAKLDDDLVRSTRPGADRRRHHVGDAPDERPYLLINDHPTKHVPEVALRIEERLAEYRARGWTLMTNDDVEAEIRAAFPSGGFDTGAATEMLERALERHALGGLLRIEAAPGDGPAADRVMFRRIDAARPGGASVGSGAAPATIAAAAA